MGDKKFTLFELHTHGENRFSPTMLNSGSKNEEMEGDEANDPDQERASDPIASSGPPVKPVLKLVAAVAVLVAGAKLVGKVADQVRGDAEGTDVEIEAEAAESRAD